MDFLLLSLGLLLMFVGMAGSILPVLPGVPVSWLGILLLYLAPSIPFDWWVVGITGVVAIGIYILDYIIPSIGTKRFGGSKAGAWGTMIGLVIGIIAPIPFGILLGPFLGALIGELVVNKTERNLAFKAAFGSFVGLLASTFVKFVFTFLYLLIFMYQVWQYRSFWM